MSEKSYKEIGRNCLNIIRDNVTPQNFKTWFKPIKAIALNKQISDNPSSQPIFLLNGLKNNYITLIKKTLKGNLEKTLG